jgi:hypothetical protein
VRRQGALVHAVRPERRHREEQDAVQRPQAHVRPPTAAGAQCGATWSR